MDDLELNADGSTTRTVSSYAGDETTLLSETVVDESADRRDVTITEDFNGDGSADFVTHSLEASDGSATITETAYYENGSKAAEAVTTISADGLVITATSDANGDDTADSVVTSTTVLNDDGSITETVDIANGDASDRSGIVTNVSANGLQTMVESDLDGDGSYERTAATTSVLYSDGSVADTSELRSDDDTLLGKTTTTVSGNGLVITEEADNDGDGSVDLTAITETVLQTHGGTVTTTELVDFDNELRNSATVSISDDTRSILTKIDANGDGLDDVVEDYDLLDNGDQVTVTSSYDTQGGLQSRSYFELSDDGLSVTTKTDFDGDDTYDSVVSDDTLLNADGSTTRTVSYKSSDGTIYSQSITEVSDDGLTVSQKHDWDNDGDYDLTATSTTDFAADGVGTQTFESQAANGDLLEKTTIVTSADLQTETVNYDADGNGVDDLVTLTEVAADGTISSSSTYYTTGGGLEALEELTVSGDGLTALHSFDSNADGHADIITEDVTTLGADGSVARDIEYRNYRNISFAHEEYVTSDDGFYSTAKLDLDGDEIFEFATEEQTVFEADGDVVRTQVTRDAAFAALSEITTVTSGNGLVSSVTADYSGDGSVDRTRVLEMGAAGGSTEVIKQYGGGYALQKSITATVSADGRTQTIVSDLDGDGFTDREVVNETDLDRNETVTYRDIALDGQTEAEVVSVVSANGTEANATMDVDGDGDIDVTRVTSTAYAVNGNRITTFTESFGTGDAAYEEVTTVAADGLSATTTIDVDGDGTVDATAEMAVTLNDDGSTFTEDTTTYADGVLRAYHSKAVSADGRTIIEIHDYDGNGIADKTSELVIRSDGTRVLTENGFNEGGMPGNTHVTSTSPDGLTTTIQRDDNVQTLTRSAVDNGSYTWDNGVAAGEYQVHITSSHEVDALGIETWAVTSEVYENGVFSSSSNEIRVDQAAREQIISDAARIYDTILDRDMDVGEVELLVLYVEDGQLDEVALVADLLLGVPTSLYELFGISPEEVLETGAAIPYTSEFSIRYGELTDAEFVTQIYLNTYGRAPGLEELAAHVEGLASGALTRGELVLEISESIEHVVVGNGHMLTNNFDVILNPAEFERSLDRAYVESVIRNMVDVVYDRDATAQEVAYLSGLLLTGTDSMEDVAAILLEVAGDIHGVASDSLTGLGNAEFVEQAFVNALGRLPSSEEQAAWEELLNAGNITQAQFVASLAQSTEHLAVGNAHVATNETVTYNLITGDSSSQTLTGTANADDIQGLEGNDTLVGADGDDRLDGGIGVDTLKGGGGNDELLGGRWNDTLQGGTGSDKLQGDAGLDTLEGGDGSDIYVWSRGDGSDTLNDTGASNTETDSLHLTDVLSGDVILTRKDGSADLTISIETSGNYEFITVTNHFNSSADGVGLEEIVFADGETWTLEDIVGKTTVSDLLYTNTLTGVSAFDETFNGGLGTDTIDAKGGDDTLKGDQGDDTLKGGDGNDTYIWSRGDDDDLINDAGLSIAEVDRLVLTDVVSAEVALTRAEGSGDLVITIDPGSGSESVITIENRYNSTEEGHGIEVIEFSDGVVWTLDDILANTLVEGSGGGDVLTGYEHVSLPEIALGGYDDTFYGKDGADTIDGKAGDDVLTGGHGVDTLKGGDGSDTYIWSDGDGSDTINDAGLSLYETDTLVLTDVASTDVTLRRTSGTDDLSIYISGMLLPLTVDGQFENVSKGYGIEAIEFSDGVIWTLEDIYSQTDVVGTQGADSLEGISSYDENLYGREGADTIAGYGGDDILVGGEGLDLLYGGDGNDIYIWSSGDGYDVIDDTGASLSDVDTLVLTDVDQANAALYRDGSDTDLKILVAGTNEIITVTDRFASAGSGFGTEVIVFQDGVIVEVLDSPVAEANVFGTSSADTLAGWDFRDTIYGYVGWDLINGNGGDDVIYGGLGNDLLRGDAGSDTYVWYRGQGDDTIDETDASLTDVDTLVLTDVASSEVKLTRAQGSYDLVVTIDPGLSSEEEITVKNRFYSVAEGYGIEAIEFGDGVVWTLDDILANTIVAGTGGADTPLSGVGDYDENFYGYAGADTIQGNGGDDTIDGGWGNDTLHGGDGNDRITGGNGQDLVYLGAGDDIFFDNSQNDSYGHDTVYGGDGNDTINGGGGNDKFYGEAGNDVITGDLGDDEIDGGTGNDSLTGGDGADIFLFATGSGQDMISDFADGSDLLDFSATGLSFGDLTISQAGSDTKIDLGDGNIVTLTGINTPLITADDFLFV